jgi:hypothetical protein
MTEYIFEGFEIDYPVAATLALDFRVVTPNPIFGMIHRTLRNSF